MTTLKISSTGQILRYTADDGYEVPREDDELEFIIENFIHSTTSAAIKRAEESGENITYSDAFDSAVRSVKLLIGVFEKQSAALNAALIAFDAIANS